MSTGALLIVDDDPIDRLLIRRALPDSAAPEVLEASSSAEALAVVDTHPVSVIILDLYLPNTEGFSLLHQLRQRLPEAAIILCTGAREAKIAKSAVREGADSYMAKILLSRASLAATIRSARTAASNRAHIRFYKKAIRGFRQSLGHPTEE